MKIINDISEFDTDKKVAIALGKFDGIHLGHIKLLNNILKKKEEGFLSVVFTFDTSASSFFMGKDIKEVTTIAEKRLIFEKMGIDVLYEYPLNDVTASVLPEAFAKDILINGLNMKYICAGEDLSFGYKGLGDVKLLKELSSVYSFELDVIDKLSYKGRDISSTYVREEIAKGNMKVVSELLGHPYSFAGKVSRGFRLGHKLGMPTMNQYPDDSKILPPLGVYYSNVIYKDTVYHGITNIGMRPTVSDTEHISVETFLYDFDMDMYNENIITELLEFKRPEMKFSSVEDLKAQMQKDIMEGRKYHK